MAASFRSHESVDSTTGTRELRDFPRSLARRAQRPHCASSSSLTRFGGLPTRRIAWFAADSQHRIGMEHPANDTYRLTDQVLGTHRRP
jgi:hypothetical protein